MLGENDGPSMISYATDGATYGLGFFLPFIPVLFVMAYVCRLWGIPHKRHTFATQLLRGGADPVLVADLLGHSGLDTLRTYTQPDDADRERALNLLTTDQ
jgi:integrase